MKTPELVKQLAVLKSLVRRVGHEPTTRDIEMQGHWGKYLCVLAAGFAENVVRLTYSAYIKKTSAPPTASYACTKIDSVQNPKSEKFIAIAASFNKRWSTDLELFMASNFRAEAINTIMSNRHLIAHGRNCSISVARVDQYISRIVEVADFIENQCGI